MKKRIVFLSLLIVSILLFVLYFVLPEKKQLEIATWVWNTELLKDDEAKIIQFIEDEKITTVYLQYVPELDYAYYQQFISTMIEREVAVYALDGSPTWARDRLEEENFFAWFTSYQNSSLPSQQFKGIHLDVESYLQSEWNRDQAEVIRQYQAMVHRVADKSKELNVLFGVDIPFWFDEIYYKNEFGAGYLAQWLIKTVDEITIMAYRNYAEGEGGIIDISETKIKWADIENKKVIIAVETVRLPEDYTSFHGHSVEKMEEQLKSVKKFYRKNRSFSGIAIHHLVSWRELKQP
jgi:hypothetical protein